MERHINKHKVLPDDSHGCRAGHSTMMAIQEFENVAKKNKGRNEHTAILAPDLTSAFDIIDHAIL